MEEMRYDTEPIVSCTIDLTEACNLACTYCFTWGNTKRVLDLKMGKRIVDFFFDKAELIKKAGRNHFEITFWGGEPLLQYNLMKKLIAYSEKKSDKVIFGGTTNGLLLDREKLEFLRDHKSKFMISLDGIKVVHDSYRIFPNGKGSWDILARKVPLILDVWPDARFRMSLSSKLIQHLFESVQWFYKEGVKWLAFSPVCEEKWSDAEFELLEEQLNLVARFMNEHKDLHCHHLSDPGRGIWQYYPCGAGRSYVGFSLDGKIYPCHRFNKYGDKKENIEVREKWCIGDIWKGFNEKRQVFLDYPKLRKEQCGDCEAYKFCSGGCYAVHVDLTGSLFSKIDSFCRYSKLIFKIGTEVVKPEKQQYDGRPCICYNMCYLEGSEEEIYYRDKSSDTSCICYLTKYSGQRPPPNTRRLVEPDGSELPWKGR